MPEQTQPTSERKHKAAKKRRQIKEVRTKLSNLSPAAAAEVVNEVVAIQTRKQVNGFVDFLREQSVVGVGIGIVFGIQVKAVVDAIMNNFISPLTTLVLPGGGLDKQTFVMHTANHPKGIEFKWGAILYSIITFIFVALIIYATYKLLKLDRLKKKS